MAVWRILLAEDDADDQALFINFLSHRTDIVLLPVAENGVELMETLDKCNSKDLPHIIILDQNMPKQNGLQTLVALKENERYHYLKVIIYSTYADDQLIMKSKAAGADMVLSKPLSKQGYDEMIEMILKELM